ncbi:GbsR/MarR family transcriptional regulator [Caldalkalibacillus salinus]|uniref:GbsR/MarR family transcriptional regulator n=1 Tax=Caldalkalibacillus salinus TaxID=2803787 RepID=UPI001F452B85|nr:transcriptional regulator [Caldalkalibacillus salinus]
MKDIMISSIAQTMVIYGVTPSVGRIYGVLYFAERPLSINEIQTEVAMSKGSVSTGIRELLEIEMVSKVWKKGDRKDHFIAEKDFFKNFMTFFVKNIRQERNIILKAVGHVKPDLEYMAHHAESERAREEARHNLELIESSQDYFDWTLRMINAMESGEIYQYIPRQSQNKEE